MGAMDRTETRDSQSRGADAGAAARPRVPVSPSCSRRDSAAPEATTLRQLEEEYGRKSASYDESHPDMISMRRQMDTLRAGGSTSGMTLQPATPAATLDSDRSAAALQRGPS